MADPLPDTAANGRDNLRASAEACDHPVTSRKSSTRSDCGVYVYCGECNTRLTGSDLGNGYQPSYGHFGGGCYG